MEPETDCEPVPSPGLRFLLGEVGTLREPWGCDEHGVSHQSMAATSDPQNTPWGGGSLRGRMEDTAEPGFKPKSLTPKAGLVTPVLHPRHAEVF